MKDITGYLRFDNPGEIDGGAITLIGASTKRGDSSKIGFFGSGLKYGLAVLIREGVPVRIFSGEREVPIGTSPREVRGQRFEVITIDGKETSLTTSMGADWEPWFAVREFYCNALDEGGGEMKIDGDPSGAAGETRVFIGFTPEIRRVVDEWDRYFTNRRTDIASRKVDFDGESRVYRGNGELIVFRKGIRVYKDSEKSLYHYDLAEIQINESRTVSSSFDMRMKVMDLLKQSATAEMAREVFDSLRDKERPFEATTDWNYSSGHFSGGWLEAIDGRTLVAEEFAGHFVEELDGTELILPHTMIRSLKKTFGNKIAYKGVADSNYSDYAVVQAKPEEASAISEAIGIIEKGGISVAYPIDVAVFNGGGVLGKAENGRIVLSRKLFSMGRREIVSAILEEYAHLDSGHGDKTRRFQNYLINMFIGQIERSSGIKI